jgi:hypothetical protein
MQISKRKRRNSVGMTQTSELRFSGVVQLAEWIANNVTDQHRQEKLMLQGVRNQCTIIITREDTAQWVTRSFGSAK